MVSGHKMAAFHSAMRSVRSCLLLAVAFTAIPLVAQNRVVSIFDSSSDRPVRAYLLDGSDRERLDYQTLAVNVKNGKINPVASLAPGWTGGVLSGAAARTATAIGEDDEGGQGVDAILGIGSNLLIYRSFSNKVPFLRYAIVKDYGTAFGTITRNAAPSDTIGDGEGELSVSSDGKMGYYVRGNQIYSVMLSNETVSEPRVISGISRVQSVYSFGSALLMCVSGDQLLLAGISGDSLKDVYPLKIKRAAQEAQSEEIFPVRLFLNPADPASFVMVAVSGKDSQNQKLYTGYLDKLNASVNVAAIPLANEKSGIAIRTCVWAPDGERLALLTGSGSNDKSEESGALQILSYNHASRTVSALSGERQFSVKISAGIVWSYDGAVLYAVEKRGTQEILARFGRESVRLDGVAVMLANKGSLAAIASLGTVPVQCRNNMTDQPLFICSIEKGLATLYRVDFTMQRAGEINGSMPDDSVVVNDRLSTFEEAIAYDIVYARLRHAAPDLKPFNSALYTTVPVGIASPRLEEAIAEYCKITARSLAAGAASLDPASAKTLSYPELVAISSGPVISAEDTETMRRRFIEWRRNMLVSIGQIETGLNRFRYHRACLSGGCDSSVARLDASLAEQIKRGAPAETLLSFISETRAAFDSAANVIGIFDTHTRRLSLYGAAIDSLMVDAKGFENRALDYGEYLRSWQTTWKSADRAIRSVLASSVVPPGGDTIAQTAGPVFGSDSTQNDWRTAIYSYARYQPPARLPQVVSRYEKNSIDGVNGYFRLNRTFLGITGGTAVLSGVAGLVFTSRYREARNQYERETVSAAAIAAHKSNAQSNYIGSMAFYGVSGAVLSAAVVYGIDFLFRLKFPRVSPEGAADSETGLPDVFAGKLVHRSESPENPGRSR